MSLRDFYIAMGGDYDEAIGFLGSEALLKKSLLKLVEDKNYENLCRALKDQDAESAFRAAHTLKGLTRTLGLTQFGVSAALMADTLRGRHTYGEDLMPVFQHLKENYEKTMDAILKLR